MRAFALVVALTSADALPFTGDVFSTLVATLYAFFAAGTFEEGALLCVNMGDDADTAGTVYGGLAGFWYGCDEDEDDVSGLFWSERVRLWTTRW